MTYKSLSDRTVSVVSFVAAVQHLTDAHAQRLCSLARRGCIRLSVDIPLHSCDILFESRDQEGLGKLGIGGAPAVSGRSSEAKKLDSASTLVETLARNGWCWEKRGGQ